MREIPLPWLPLVGLLAIPFVVAFVVVLEPVAVLAVVNTLLIVFAVRVMLGSTDTDYLPPRWT
jgi:hypothetical protein